MTSASMNHHAFKIAPCDCDGVMDMVPKHPSRGVFMVSENIKRTVGNLKPLIKEIPNRLVEKADQVLLGLSHTKESIPTLFKQTLNRIENNPNDLVGRVGRSVLERAEEVRKQLVEKAGDADSRLNPRWVPDWLKDVTFVSAPGEAAPLVDSASAPVVETAAAVDVADTVQAVATASKKTAPKKAGVKKDGFKKEKAATAKKSRAKKA